MKVGVEWLKDYSDIDVDVKELSEILTMTGSKVEGYESKGNDIKNVVVGKILEIEKHPDADKLVVTKVDVKDEILQIVTGAKNIKVGDIIPIAKIGSELPGDIKIKKGSLRGVESCGMMCSIGELGLTLEDMPNQIEDGIMILPKEYESKLGENIVDVLDLRDDIIEFEITPNRPDCLSVEGLGRETAVSLNKEYKNPNKNIDKLKIDKKNEMEGLKVTIDAPDLCYRYTARVVKNIVIKESPDWMRKRLKACGVRPINNIVDITNYVMLEMGQPMHAFDINSIANKHIIVRRAKDGETLKTLDGIDRKLDNSMLVISDEKKIDAIAGVMGEENSEIEKDTKMVVFESAVFNGGSVRMTAKKLGLRTEASSRYEKGLPQENAIRAVNRAVELVELLGAGEAIDGVIDEYPEKQKEIKIEFNPHRINNLLGINVSEDEMVNILNKLDIKVVDGYCIPPYYRQDLEQDADIAEEILRIYGYDKLESSLDNSGNTVGGRSIYQKMEDNIKNMLVNKGFSEICTYGFINPEELAKSNILENSELYKEVIKIRNPISEDYSIMKTSVVPTMMKSISSNYAKKNDNLKLFEYAKVYKNKSNIENNELPDEEQILTIAITGKEEKFYDLKGIVENVLETVNLNRYDISKYTENTSYHPGKTAIIKIGNDPIIIMGQIHPIVQENYDISDKVYIAEINMKKLEKYSKKEKKYVPIPKYPAVERDIAVLVDEKIEVLKIEKLIKAKAKKILEEVNLFDIYRNEKIGENKKSVAYALKFRAKDRTLKDDEISKVMENIIKALKEELGAELRK